VAYKEAVIGVYAYLRESELGERRVRSLIEELTLIPRGVDGPGEPVYLFDRRDGWIGVPWNHMELPLPQLATNVKDLRSDGKPVEFGFTSKLREGQVPVINQFEVWLQAGATSFLLEARPGFGKCHGRGTELLMFDGTVKKVEDIQVGDQLMGPDSQPRTVQSLAHGFDEMFRVTPKNGDPFTCNREHVMSLKASSGLALYPQGGVIEVPLHEFLRKGKTYRAKMKLWRPAGVFYAERAIPFHPYLIGMYIGDGSRHNSCVTLGDSDSEMVEFLYRWAHEHLVEVRTERGSGCTEYHLTQSWKPGYSIVRSELLPLVVVGTEKRIPPAYLANSFHVRMEVLAGLLDSDGSLVKETVYDFVTKWRGLADDVARLARSLGFACRVSPCTKACNGKSGQYFRLTISGDTQRLAPYIKLPRKKARQRRQIKDWLMTGFAVDSLGSGEYFGFTLDGDGLYLLKDFTVTHNTVTVLKMLQWIGRTALILVPRSNLVKQWIERALQHTNLKRNEIGYVVGNKWNWRNKKLVVGLVHSLALDRIGKEFRKSFGVLVADEVDHSVPPATFAPVINLFPTKYRIGASAEMKRFDGMHAVFEKHFGQVRLVGVAGEDEVMIPKVVSVEFRRNEERLYAGLGTMQRRGVILSRLAKDPVRNRALAKYVGMLYRSGRRTVVLSDRVAHLQELAALVARTEGIPRAEMGFYHGGVEDRARHRVAIACNVIFATYQMFALGTDIQDLAGLVYATPQSSVVQSKGRIERVHGDKKCPVVVDFVDTAYPDTVRWAKKRLAQYRKDGMSIRNLVEGVS